ncbi:Hypothetical predicted protein, partial [Paramuricea clavata]
MDVKAAYLNAPIDCDIFVEQPKGYEKVGGNGKKLVCKLNKSLYGLKQSGRNWNATLHNYLVKEGFMQSQADPCVYHKFVDGDASTEFKCSDGMIEMNQTRYIEKVLEKFGMNNCKPKTTPSVLGFDKVIDMESAVLEDPNSYRQIVGSLIYVMTGTRPDLCHIVTKLSQHMSKPTAAALNAAKHVL